MLLFTTHNYFLFTRKEIWFYDDEPIKKGTYNVYTASRKKSDVSTKFQETYRTPIVYLEKPEDILFKAIHSTYRYDIRAAEKKKLTYETVLTPNKADCVALYKAYTDFAKTKHIEQMNFRRIIALQKD
ncbi:MAG TPA: hypothetical protein VKG26_09445, partial [Bacteroidia bacterium]|nr:hypothetical protein [Bacteroidia bacterium]